jgi:cytochrome c2
MLQRILFVCAAGVLMLALAACGSQPAPRYVSDATETAEADAERIRATELASGFTATPTSTSTPTTPPTWTPTATLTPTVAPPTNTPEPTPTLTTSQRIQRQVADADPANGEALWTGGVQPACNTCHYIDSDERLVGPGMAGLYARAGERVVDQGAYEYVFTSIRNSQAYIVEDYPAEVMINYTEDLLSDEQIYDLMAYLQQATEQ